MTSGFGELGDEGKRAQARMAAAAQAAGMRLVGPNCQGLANFATGAVANFSTIFHEMEGRDGPVAIISQSGACSQAIYIHARQRGLDVRHVHATGNEADVTVSDHAEVISQEEGVRLILLFMEAIQRPVALARAAAHARSRGVPIVAVKAGRTASGVRAASSHTGALASEDRVIDAFFEKHAIWRAADPQELVAAGQLSRKGGRPKGRRFVAGSTSGASCVMAADAAAILDHAGWPAAHVVGHSLGGCVAIELALAHPERVLSLALLCTGPSGRQLADTGFSSIWRGIRYWPLPTCKPHCCCCRRAAWRARWLCMRRPPGA